MPTAIPRKLSHIWIGPLAPPSGWMETWKKAHPDWEYELYGNEFLKKRDFRTRRQITEYLKRGQYAGAADLMRLEILLERGGLMPGADSICLRSMEPLFTKTCAYTVYENEFVRGRLVSPIQACEPGNPFVGKLIEHLSNVSPENLDEPWISTGNLFTAQMIESLKPDIVIFPSHFMIPVHFTGVISNEGFAPFAVQMFGTTRGAYPQSTWARLLNYLSKMKQKRYNRKSLMRSRERRANLMHLYDSEAPID